MTSLSASQIAEILGHPVVAGDAGVVAVGGVCTDTRKLVRGAVFFALRGEKFDADAFAAGALAGGAAVAVVHGWEGQPPDGTAVIRVQDTLAALQRLASWWRSRLDLRVVAVTGSNGKTSVKDFTAAVLGRRFGVSATVGNLNNHIGLPLTVLAAGSEHTVAVWEMGMNHANEIAPLCEIARPEFGIITNIGSAHIEFLGSRQGIAAEKGMLARALPPHGRLFVPESCDFNDYFRSITAAGVVTVDGPGSPVRSGAIEAGPTGSRFELLMDGEAPQWVELAASGRHMVTNALLAAAVGRELGVPAAEVAAGLSGAVLTSGRLRRFNHDGVVVFDDTYNANPESMAAAIATLAATVLPDGARRFIVLGRMGELGDHAAAAHRNTGEQAAVAGLVLIAVGEGAEGIAAGAGGAPHFVDLADAAAWLRREVKSGDAVLFKGSRTAAIERVMRATFPES